MRTFWRPRLSSLLTGLAFCVFLALVLSQNSLLSAQDDDAAQESNIKEVMAAMERDYQPAYELAAMAITPCVGGMAGSYPCQNVDLMSFLPLSAIGGGNGNDIWGWTDPLTNKEYAIMGRTSGTSFVDITDPENPIYLGNLPTHTVNSTWRDIKVYANHAFIVSEASGHGMQVFNLIQLRTVTSPPVTFSNTAHYSGFGNAHNIAINEATGFAYAVGTSTCSGGLHMVNIQNPTSPSNAGCFSSDGYTHDTQCVIYTGLDTTYQGQEICFNSNEDTLTIVNVNNKSAPVQLARTGYAGSRYTHQGWLTEDQRYFLLDDELDEQNNGHNTRTYIWDVADLNAPVLIGNFTSSAAAIDHNQYVKGNYSYQANYRAGLRILNLTNVASGSLTEAGYFDIYPANNNANFNGAWSTYPYFTSGMVIVSGIEQGLFVLRPNLSTGPTPTPSNTPIPPTPTNTPLPTNTPGPSTCTVYNSTNVPISLPNGTTSINSQLTVSGGGTIVDVNFTVNMSHVYVGDLSMSLASAGTGRAVTVLDRPGVPASTYGCSGDNIVATLDDEASLPVENQCAGSAPTINGTFTPNNALSTFDGQSSNGNWVLTVTDHYPSADAGTLNSWSLEICTAGAGPTPTNTSVPPTATNTPIPPTPTNTPIPGGDDLIYASSSTSGTAGGVAFADEDILIYDTGTGTWSMFFDGSDVGLGSTDVDAFDLLDDGTFLLSLDASFSVSGLGTVADVDIIRFVPTSTGDTTSGTFEWFFDGSDVGLTTTNEDVDALDYTTDGKLIISTLGTFSVTGASGEDEDLLIFTPSALGATTSGTWAFHFDGSDVGLSTSSSEDINGAWQETSSDDLYLTALGSFAVTGVSGDGADIFVCIPGSFGSTTSCTFTLYWDGSANGFAGEVLDAFGVVRP